MAFRPARPTTPRPPLSNYDPSTDPTGKGSYRRLLGRAVQDLLALTGASEALVTLLHPQRGIDLWQTPGLSRPPEATVRTMAQQLVSGEADVRWSDAGSCPGVALPVGDDSTLCAIVASATADARARLREHGPLFLQSLAREILLLRGRDREAELQRLNATAGRVAASLNLDEVLNEIIRDATELLGADMGDIVLLDSRTDRLRIVAASGQQSVGVEWSADKGLSSRTMAARRTVVVRDYQRYRYRIEELAEYEVHAVLCAPLIAGNVVIGTITVHSRDRLYEFTPHHAQLLSAFASHAAVAIENARRYQAEVHLGRELREANDQLARSLTLQQRLVEQVLNDHGIGGVARELADVLQRPTVLHDELLRTLAGASPLGGQEWEALALPGDGLGDPDLAAFLRELSSTRVPSLRPAPLSSGPARLVAPVVRSAADVWGYLVLPWPGELTPLDRALIQVAITGVALEMAKLRARVDLEQELRGEVLLDLLNGTFSSPETIGARVAQLGFDLAQPRHVAVLHLAPTAGLSQDVGESEQLLWRRRFRDIAVSRVAVMSPASMVAADGDVVVLLAAAAEPPAASPLELVQEVARCVRATIPGAVVSGMIGDLCTATGEYARAYRSARSTLDAARRLAGPGRIVEAQSLGVARLIISAGDRDLLLDFARRTLGPLLVDGSGSDRQLLSTLRAYVDAGFNQRATARRAFLHPNTVAYRLRKAEQRLGASLADPLVRLDLSFALRIGALADLF